MVELMREHDLLRAAVRGAVRRHRHRRADGARRDRGALEGLRDDRADPRRAGARLARAQARRARTSRRQRFLPRLASGEWLARLRAHRAGLGLGLGGDAHRGAARGRRVRPQRRRSASSRTRASPRSTSSSRRPTPRRATRGSRRSSSRRTRPGSRSGGSSRRWGSRARRPARSSSTTAASRPRTCSARRARASGSRCGSSTARGRGSRAQGLGLAQGATDYALEYAKTRETMGKPIAEHQLIAAMLADMETKCEAARGLLYRCGQMIDEGVDGPRADEDLGDGEALLHGRGDGGHDRRRPDPRRLRLHLRSTRSSG